MPWVRRHNYVCASVPRCQHFGGRLFRGTCGPASCPSGVPECHRGKQLCVWGGSRTLRWVGLGVAVRRARPGPESTEAEDTPAATGISGGPAEGGGLPTAGRRASSRRWLVVSPPCISWTQPQAWHPGWGSGETVGAGVGAEDAGWSRGTTVGSALFVSWAAWPNPPASGPSSLAPPGHLPCELRADPTPPGPRAVAPCSALRLAPRPGPLLPDALHWAWVAHAMVPSRPVTRLRPHAGASACRLYWGARRKQG